MKPAPFSPEETDQIAKEVNEDIEAGVGDKHFQEIFDSIQSTQGSAHVEEDPGVRDRIARFMIDFHNGLNSQLRGNEHGFACLAVNADGKGTGFVCKFRDRTGRPFTVDVTYDDGFEAASKRGVTEMGRGMLDVVLERLIAAREKWFARMGKLH